MVNKMSEELLLDLDRVLAMNYARVLCMNSLGKLEAQDAFVLQVWTGSKVEMRRRVLRARLVRERLVQSTLGILENSFVTFSSGIETAGLASISFESGGQITMHLVENT
jgi:hypothetical protein